MKWFTLPNALRLLAFILWFYIPVFVITMLGIAWPEFKLFNRLTPEIRGEYHWDFELMFVSIYAIWGWFLWLASKEPKKHTLFIDFSIWANVALGAVMILTGMLREGEFHHLLGDGLVLIVPALMILYLKKNETKNT